MMPSAFLAIDASSEVCSAALQLSHVSSIVRHSIAPRQHNHLLQTYVSDLLSHIKNASAQLEAVIVGYGPGSFAGVRIATAIAQGVAAVYQIPLVGVSSLKATALHFAQQQSLLEPQVRERLVLVLNDAKMQEAYMAAYRIQGKTVEIEHQDRLVAYVDCRRLLRDWFEAVKDRSMDTVTLISQDPIWARNLLSADLEDASVGEQWALFTEACTPHAGAVLSLGMQDFHRGLAVAAEQFEPLYLRQATAWKTLDRQ